MYTVLLFKFGRHLCKGSKKLRQQSIKMSASEDEVVAFDRVKVRHLGENTGVSSTPLSLKMLQYDHFPRFFCFLIQIPPSLLILILIFTCSSFSVTIINFFMD